MEESSRTMSALFLLCSYMARALLLLLVSASVPFLASCQPSPPSASEEQAVPPATQGPAAPPGLSSENPNMSATFSSSFSAARVVPSKSKAAHTSSAAPAVKAKAVSSVQVGVPPLPPPAPPRVILMSVKNWQFSPAGITVKGGEKVVVRLKGESGIHGFAVPGLGINQRVAQGRTEEVTLPTDKPGTYDFFCSIPCGAGHRDMKGKIIIQ